MSKTIIIALMVLLSGTISQAQELYFSKSNYADSTKIAHALPELARKIIAEHASHKEVSSKNNLFRLQLVAHQYAKVSPTLRELGQEMYTDSSSIRALGFSFRILSNVLHNNPKTQAAFESDFEKQFFKLYQTLDQDGHTMVNEYYEKDLPQLKTDFETKLAQAQQSDRIDLPNAVALCRSYCSYFTFWKTLKLAKPLLQKISEQKYEINESILLTMTDGGTVSVTVVRSKTTTEPLPVVLMNTIYAGADVTPCKEAVNKGFVGVVANTRGKRLSTDNINPFEYDGNDLYEVIDWISKQSWCNGKVGMYGGSYLGFSQWSALKKKHPALKTIVPQVAVGAGVDFPMYNGVFMSYMLQWIHFVTNTKLTDLADFSNFAHWNKVFTDYYVSGKPFNTLDAIDGRLNAIFQRWLQHSTYDEYWKKMTPQKEEFSTIDIPILSTTGYYDDDQLGALYYYKQYQKWNTNDKYYLIIGPYDHAGAQGYPISVLNDYTIDDVANIPIQDIVYQWFNYTLKEGPKPAFLKDKVNYQMMGTNTWRHAPSLAKMSNQNVTYYISANKTLTKKADSKKFLTQTIDFKDRSVVKINGENTYCGFSSFQPSTLPLDRNAIVFESEPLTEALALTGAIEANLVIETNKKDVDLTLMLYEKRANGTYFALSSNLQRASLAKDSTQRELLTPNTKQIIPLKNNFMACKQLDKGSYIVIVLGINNSADFEINYGTGKEVSTESIADAAVPLQIKWYCDSTISIPVNK